MSIADVNYLKDRTEHQATAKQLLSIMEPLIRCHSGSGDEQQIAECILKFVEERCPGWTAFSDGAEGIGNVLAVPTKYLDKTNTFASMEKLPVLMAHMDTNYAKCELPEEELRERLSTYTFADITNGDAQGIVGDDSDLILGFDDKAGIALILYLMSNYQEPDFKVLFTVQEEKTEREDLKVCGPDGRNRREGGGGIQYALNKYPEFFETSLWAIMVDRAEDRSENVENDINVVIRGDEPSDIVYRYLNQDTCSPAFRAKIEEISCSLGTPMLSRRSNAKADTYNIRLSRGSSYSSVNLAAGGYREHRPGDYLCIYQTVRTLRIVEECIRQQKKLYEASLLQ